MQKKKKLKSELWITKLAIQMVLIGKLMLIMHGLRFCIETGIW